MGRYLAMGLPTRIHFYKKESYTANSEFKILDNKEDILKKIKNYIDISFYDFDECTDGSDAFGLKLNEKMASENIHDVIKEVVNLIDDSRIRDALYYKEEIDYDNFSNENHPLFVHQYKDDDEYESDWQKKHLCDSYCLKSNSGEIGEDMPFYSSEYWLFDYDRELTRNIEVNMLFFALWIDIDKFDSEDETRLIQLINKFSRRYFKNDLSNNLLFYISG